MASQGQWFRLLATHYQAPPQTIKLGWRGVGEDSNRFSGDSAARFANHCPWASRRGQNSFLLVPVFSGTFDPRFLETDCKIQEARWNLMLFLWRNKTKESVRGSCVPGRVCKQCRSLQWAIRFNISLVVCGPLGTGVKWTEEGHALGLWNRTGEQGDPRKKSTICQEGPLHWRKRSF